MSDADELEFAIKSLTRSSDRRVIALLRGHAKLEAEAQALREEVAALRARVVVVPETLNEGDARRECGEYGTAMQRGYNACLRELSRLNGKAVSEELLYRIADTLDDVCHGSALEKELRDLLGEGKEHE